MDDNKIVEHKMVFGVEEFNISSLGDHQIDQIVIWLKNYVVLNYEKGNVEGAGSIRTVIDDLLHFKEVRSLAAQQNNAKKE